jgi:hypothetical protein
MQLAKNIIVDPYRNLEQEFYDSKPVKPFSAKRMLQTGNVVGESS